MMTYIGLDIGTTSLCGVAVNTDTWQITSVKTCLNDAHIPSTFEWEHTQKPERIFFLVKDLLDSFFTDYSDIGSIAFSTQMHGILYVDSKGNACSPFYTWQDQHSALPEEKDGHAYYQVLEEKLGRKCPPGYGLSTHYALVKSGEFPTTAKKFCSIGDFVAMKLAGQTSPVSEPTLSDSYGILFLGDKNYNTDNLESAGVDSALLPNLVPSATIIGTYKNVPLITAIGDNPASFLGSIENLYSNAVLSLGTSGQISCYSTKPLSATGIETRPFLDDGFLLLGASLCGGQSYALLKGFFAETLRWLGKKNDASVFEQLYEKLNTIDPQNFDNAPIFNPLFCGTRSNPQSGATMQNITATNFSPQHLTAALVCGVVQELKDFFELFPKELHQNINTLYGSGSFFNKNPHVLTLSEKLFALPVKKTPRKEEGAFGATMNAGVALKNFLDYNDSILHSKGHSQCRKKNYHQN